jgi:hypothetical protein
METIEEYAELIRQLCSPRKVRNVKFLGESSVYYEFECPMIGDFSNYETLEKSTLQYLYKELGLWSIDQALDLKIEVAEQLKYKFNCFCS